MKQLTFRPQNIEHDLPKKKSNIRAMNSFVYLVLFRMPGEIGVGDIVRSVLCVDDVFCRNASELPLLILTKDPNT